MGAAGDGGVSSAAAGGEPPGLPEEGLPEEAIGADEGSWREAVIGPPAAGGEVDEGKGEVPEVGAGNPISGGQMAVAAPLAGTAAAGGVLVARKRAREKVTSWAGYKSQSGDDDEDASGIDAGGDGW